jgi:hypothetical protein
MNEFKQQIVNVQASTVLVKSSKGTIYPVVVSDRVRLSGKTINKGDTGVIHRTNGRYYLYDVIPKQDETDSYLSDVPLGDLGYDY